MVVSFPYTGSLFPLVFVAWVPLLLIEHNIYREKYRSGKVFIHAYLTFLIYNIGTTFWIYFSVGGEVGAILAYVLNSLLMAIVFMLFHWTKRFVGQKEGYIGILFFWLGFEYFHYHWELSWPWLNIGNVFSVFPEIVQWYSYTGVLGGGLWILLVNLLVFKFVSNVIFSKESLKVQTPLIYFSLALILVPSLLSYWSYSSYTEKKDPIEVVVTQPNVDPYNEKFSISSKEQIKKVIDQADSLITPKTAIVLGPETAIPYSFDELSYNSSRGFIQIQNAVKKWNGPAFYIGASTYRLFDKKERVSMKAFEDRPGFYEHYNTSMLVSSTKPPQFIHKSKLVLGVEKVPFSNWFPSLENLSVENGGTSGTLGIENEPKVLRSSGFSFAPVVCYESIYGGFVAAQCRKGAEVIFVITNDGWWGDSPGHKQHASFARLRAIETGRYVVRSANTGISSVINQRGDVIKQTEYWVEDAFRTTVNLNDERTFYIEYGDVIGRSFGFVFFLLIILTIVKYLRTFGKSY
tara:strand:- start:87018 stop:88574 length:1557 start_codon:yes stop_codon:yes gene_type:complete